MVVNDAPRKMMKNSIRKIKLTMTMYVLQL